MNDNRSGIAMRAIGFVLNKKYTNYLSRLVKDLHYFVNNSFSIEFHMIGIFYSCSKKEVSDAKSE